MIGKNMFRMAAAACLLWCSSVLAATAKWVGGTSTDFATAANWDPASVPVGGDDVIIDYGSQDITTGLDQSAKDFNSVVIGPNYTGQCGNSTSDRLLFGTAKLVIMGGGATQYLGTGGTHDWVETYIRGVGPAGTGTAYLHGTIVTLHVQKGQVSVATGSTVTTAYLDALAGAAANVTYTTAATTTTTIYTIAANVGITAGTITTLYVDAGTTSVTGGTVTNLVQRGGTVEWATTTTLADAKIFKGTFDASGDVNAKTITTIASYGVSILNLDNGLGNITLTNGVKYYSGAVIWPAGMEPDY